MATDTRLAVLLLWLLLPLALFADFRRQEVTAAYEAKRYAQVLERTLTALNAPADKLGADDRAFLLHYTALAYKYSGNPDMASTYWQRLEQECPESEWLKNAWQEQADMAAGDFMAREPYLRRLFQKFADPDGARAGLEMSKNYVAFGSYQKALLILDRIVNGWKLGDSLPEAYMLMAICFANMHDNVQSIRSLNKAEAAVPELIAYNPEYSFWAGRIAFDNLNFVSAVRHLQRLQNVFPGHRRQEETALLLAQALERDKRPFLGAIALMSALERDPATAWRFSLMLNLARLLLRLPADDLARAAKQSPRFASPQDLLQQVQEKSPSYEERRESTILLSQNFRDRQQLDKALDNYRRFLDRRRDPLVEEFFRTGSDELLSRLIEQGRLEDILEFWIRVSDHKSYLSPESLLKIAVALTRSGMLSSAGDILDHILKYRLYSRFWDDARRQQVRVSFARGDYPGCLGALGQASPANAAEAEEFNYLRAMCWLNLKQDRELDAFLAALDCPESAVSYPARLCLLKADRLENRKEYRQALPIYLALSRSPAPPLPLGRLLTRIGDIYYLLDDMEQALAYYAGAEPQLPRGEWIAYQKATILSRLGRTAEAEAEVRRLRQINAGSYWLRQIESDVR